jgi:NADP-dependent 3-hydroxy acid dehydrogenase YdfG
MSYLKGKSVVITGAAGGFGRLVAEMALERGASVAGLDIDGATVDATFAALAADGRPAIGLHVDVTDFDQVRSAVDAAVEAFGGVDVMINNAGVMPNAYLRDHARALPAWDRCIDINLKGVLHGVCAVYDHMIRQGRGHIVNISSIYGNAGVAGAAVYSATKAAVVALSNALRAETQGAIKVTIVRPSGVPGTGSGRRSSTAARSFRSPPTTPPGWWRTCGKWWRASWRRSSKTRSTRLTGPFRRSISLHRSSIPSTSHSELRSLTLPCGLPAKTMCIDPSRPAKPGLRPR